MSHKKLTSTLLILTALFMAHCAKLGEAQLGLSQQNTVPTQPIATTTTKPGMGADGGPSSWSFWVKNRQATSDTMLGSFAPFYKVSATRHAVSANFVLYRDSLASNLTTSQAATVLANMESAFASLKSVYGAGQKPDANNNARIVILAYDILDDYSTTLNYVGGFFAPRDLYSNAFTTALFTDPVTIQQYSSVIATLGGYSNEMSIIYYDLSPGYSTNPSQVNDIVVHELSHLFTYNRRVVKERLVNHDVWIAEGIAENAPHQTLQKANVQQLRLTQLSSPATIDYYQDAPQLTDFVTWGPKVIGYIQSNLFFNYLRHRAEMNFAGSSATMLTELMTTPDQTITGLESMIGKYIPGNNFSSIYADYVITNYLMLLGIPIDATTGLNGGAASQLKFSQTNVQIGNSSSTVNGTTIKSKYPTDMPFNYEAPKCADGTVGLKPNSYIIFRSQYLGLDKTTVDSPGAGEVAGELPLKYIINANTETVLISGAPPATVNLYTYDAGQTLPLVSLAGTFAWVNPDFIHMIIYNPNKSGSCRPFDKTLIAKRNHSRWIGSNSYGVQPSPDAYWQSDVGASWSNNTNGGFYRPSGIAAYTTGVYPTSYPNNFIYAVDYTSMAVQKMNLDDGSPQGRLGNTSLTCPTSGVGWDFSTSRYVNNYCAHSFDAPQGIAIDSTNGDVYIADSSNRRVVKYDSAGNFVAWLGNAAGWQGAGTVTTSISLFTQGSLPAPRTGTTTVGSAVITVASTTGLHIAGIPVSGAGIPAGATILSAILDTSITLDQPATATGATTLTFTGGCSGYDPQMIQVPWGIAVDGTRLFVVDNQSNRLIVFNKASGNFISYFGNGNTNWTAAPTGTAAACSASSVLGNDMKSLSRPRGMTINGSLAYIADSSNMRVMEIDIANTTAGAGTTTRWLGDGNSGWQTSGGSSGAASNQRYFMNTPSGVAHDGTNLYITDQKNNRIIKWSTAGVYGGWLGWGKVKWETGTTPPPESDTYAGVSYYPPDFYAEPDGITFASTNGAAVNKKYIFFTSVYNGRITRVNVDCATNPTNNTFCTPVYTAPW